MQHAASLPGPPVVRNGLGQLVTSLQESSRETHKHRKQKHCYHAGNQPDGGSLGFLATPASRSATVEQFIIEAVAKAV